MTIHESQTPSRSNIETGVPGFDEILGGGLVSGGVYLLEGMAGAGKTILSSQIGFHRVSKGEKVLYVTLIAESHDKLLAHLKGLSFFDETAVAQQQDVASNVKKEQLLVGDPFLRRRLRLEEKREVRGEERENPAARQPAFALAAHPRPQPRSAAGKRSRH